MPAISRPIPAQSTKPFRVPPPPPGAQRRQRGWFLFVLPSLRTWLTLSATWILSTTTGGPAQRQHEVMPLFSLSPVQRRPFLTVPAQ